MSNTKNSDTDQDKETFPQESKRIKCYEEQQNLTDTEEVTDSSVEELEVTHMRKGEQMEFVRDEELGLEMENKSNYDAEMVIYLKNKSLQGIKEMKELDLYELEKERIGEKRSKHGEDNTLLLMIIGNVSVKDTDTELCPIRSHIDRSEKKNKAKIKKTLSLYENNSHQTFSWIARKKQHFIKSFSNRRRNFRIELGDVIHMVIELMGSDIMERTELSYALQNTTLRHGGESFSMINVQAEMTSFDIKKALLGYTNETEENKSLLTIQTVLKSNRGLDCLVYLTARFIRKKGMVCFKKHNLTQTPFTDQNVMSPKYDFQNKKNTVMAYNHQRMMENWKLLFASLLSYLLADDSLESSDKTSHQIVVSFNTEMNPETYPEEMTTDRQESDRTICLQRYIIVFYLLYEAANYVHKQNDLLKSSGSKKIKDGTGIKPKNNQTKNWRSKICTREKLLVDKMVRNLTKCEENYMIKLLKGCLLVEENVVCLQKKKFYKNNQSYYMMKIIILSYIHDQKLNQKQLDCTLDNNLFHEPLKEECLWNYSSPSYDHLFEFRKNSIPAVNLQVNMQHGAETMNGLLEHSNAERKLNKLPTLPEKEVNEPYREKQLAENHSKTQNPESYSKTQHSENHSKTWHAGNHSETQSPENHSKTQHSENHSKTRTECNVNPDVLNQMTRDDQRNKKQQQVQSNDYSTNDIKISFGKTKVTDQKHNKEPSARDRNINPECHVQYAAYQVARPKSQPECPFSTVDIHCAKKVVLPKDIDNIHNLMNSGHHTTNQNVHRTGTTSVSQKNDTKEEKSSDLFGNGPEPKCIKPNSICTGSNHSTSPESLELFGTGKILREMNNRLRDNADFKRTVPVPQGFKSKNNASPELYGDRVELKVFFPVDLSDINSAVLFGDGNKTNSPEEAIGAAICGRSFCGNNSHVSVINRSRVEMEDPYHGAREALRIDKFMEKENLYDGILCGTEKDLEKFFQKKSPIKGVVIDEILQRVARHPLEEEVDSYKVDNYDVNKVRKIGFGYFKIDNKLGSGSYGVAYLCSAKVPESKKKFLFVLKQIKLERFNSSEGLVPLLHARHCPQVLKIYGAYEDNDCMNILIEYAAGGTLYKVIQDDIWDMTMKITCIHTLLKGLNYLHSQNIVVYDLKMDNIVLKNEGDPFSVAYIDWGSSKLNSQKGPINYRNGTPLFLPPEIHHILVNKDSQFNQSLKLVDIWGLGCVFYKMIKKEYVWQDITSELAQLINISKTKKHNFRSQLIDRQRYNIYDAIDQINHEELDDIRLPSVLHLLSRLLDPYPGSRILTEEALQHLLFSENRRYLTPLPDMRRILDMKTVPRNGQFKVWVTVFYKEKVIAHVYVLKGLSGKDLYKLLGEKINKILPELKDSEYYFVLDKTAKFHKDCVVELKQLK